MSSPYKIVVHPLREGEVVGRIVVDDACVQTWCPDKGWVETGDVLTRLDILIRGWDSMCRYIAGRERARQIGEGWPRRLVWAGRLLDET